MFFSKKKARAVTLPERVIHQFVFIEAPLEFVWPEIVLWSESKGWPKKGCAIKIKRRGSGEIELGARFRQLAKPFALSWSPFALRLEMELTECVPQELIRRTFVKGPLQGYESIKLEWRYNGTRVDYDLPYRVKGFLNKIFWIFFYEKLYSQSMRRILDALKEYVTKLYKEKQERNFEHPSA